MSDENREQTQIVKSYTKRTTAAKRGELAAFKKKMGSGVYNGMINRCTDPNNAQWKNYGGRGITVCKEWRENPDEFYLWAMTHGWRKGLQIDRTDNSKGYSPWNCRFVTAKENCRNTRANIPVAIYDTEGNLLTVCPTITTAAELTNTAVGTVMDSINKVIDVASGKYRFVRTDGEILPGYIVSCKDKSVKVTDTATGKEDLYINESRAAKHFRVNHVTIRHWCQGMKVEKAENASNLKFEYISRADYLRLKYGIIEQLQFDFDKAAQTDESDCQHSPSLPRPHATRHRIRSVFGRLKRIFRLDRCVTV